MGLSNIPFMRHLHVVLLDHALHDVMDRFLIHKNAPPIFIGDASYQKYYKIVNEQEASKLFWQAPVLPG